VPPGAKRIIKTFVPPGAKSGDNNLFVSKKNALLIIL
jgi:hypothetical protein